VGEATGEKRERERGERREGDMEGHDRAIVSNEGREEQKGKRGQLEREERKTPKKEGRTEGRKKERKEGRRVEQGR
jgi:hypothetical protein